MVHVQKQHDVLRYITKNTDTPSYCIVVLMAPQKTDIRIIPHILAFRLVEETNDDVLKMEMDPLIESLTVSGQHVLLATQKLSIQPEISSTEKNSLKPLEMC